VTTSYPKEHTVSKYTLADVLIVMLNQLELSLVDSTLPHVCILSPSRLHIEEVRRDYAVDGGITSYIVS